MMREHWRGEEKGRKKSVLRVVPSIAVSSFIVVCRKRAKGEQKAFSLSLLATALIRSLVVLVLVPVEMAVFPSSTHLAIFYLDPLSFGFPSLFL